MINATIGFVDYLNEDLIYQESASTIEAKGWKEKERSNICGISHGPAAVGMDPGVCGNGDESRSFGRKDRCHCRGDAIGGRCEHALSGGAHGGERGKHRNGNGRRNDERKRIVKVHHKTESGIPSGMPLFYGKRI